MHEINITRVAIFPHVTCSILKEYLCISKQVVGQFFSQLKGKQHCTDAGLSSTRLKSYVGDQLLMNSLMNETNMGKIKVLRNGLEANLVIHLKKISIRLQNIILKSVKG